ncbi:twin-arginine translocation signal domain-containing protein [uncultured Thiocystis sp.]|jgi:hypothetical protein|uniref:twin-arginine translocation signal domain-containing protein n=1 Tax=uncultured Thiocystis sp. TaxID=1202134 RepID=UPI0025DB1781|nr:twin-arginine translocation signal domain-containing protein [uncultured Thiocystis sp.]
MNEINDRPTTSEGRRRLLKTLAVGGATAALLPEKWVTPVIDKILVPAHAQTSVVNPFVGIYSNNGPQFGFGYNPSNLFERLADALIPSAHAALSIQCPAHCVAFQVFENATVNVWVDGTSDPTNINPVSGLIANVNGFTDCVVQGTQLTGFNNLICEGAFFLGKVDTLPIQCANPPE